MASVLKKSFRACNAYVMSTRIISFYWVSILIYIVFAVFALVIFLYGWCF